MSSKLIVNSMQKRYLTTRTDSLAFLLTRTSRNNFVFIPHDHHKKQRSGLTEVNYDKRPVGRDAIVRIVYYDANDLTL